MTTDHTALRALADWHRENAKRYGFVHEVSTSNFHASASAAILALLDELDAAQRDAERYRWLKQNPEWLGWERDFSPGEVEKEIDAAMKGQP